MSTEAEKAWLESQAYAAYGDQEDVRDTFYMGWDACLARQVAYSDMTPEQRLAFNRGEKVIRSTQDPKYGVDK